MDMKQLITETPKGFLDRALEALAARSMRTPLQEAAYTGLLWRDVVRLATTSVPNLRIIQTESGAERRDRLVSDLEMLGLPGAAASIEPVVAFANERVQKDASYERFGFRRVLSMQMEAGDAHIDNARKAMVEHDPKSEDVEQIITEFLRSNASDFVGVAVPEQKKGLFGRLFG